MNSNKIGNIIYNRFYNGFRSRSYSTSRILDPGRQAGRVIFVKHLSGQLDRQDGRPRARPIAVVGQLQTAGLATRAKMSRRFPIEPQRVDAPLTQSATFLVLSVASGPDAIRTVRSTLASIDGLAKNVAIRDLGASFACTVGIGSDAWERVTDLARPAELHPFPAVKGAVHTAPSTPGD